MFPSEEKIRSLSLVDILESLSREQVEELAWQVPDIRLGEGEILYAPGDAAGKFFILRSGSVRIYKVAAGRQFTLAVMRPGNMFGEMAPSGQRPREAYAQATEPSEVSVLSSADVRRLVLEHPGVALRTVDLLAERLRIQESRMADLALKEVPARLAGLILLLVESEGVVSAGGLRIPIHYTHHLLGTMVGANREAVTRALGHLRRSGAIEIRGRQIHVQNLETLRRIAR